jgi:hypothetical protein
MHSSLHNILAAESARSRQAAASEVRLAASLRRPLAALAARVAAAHGIPPRAAPGKDSSPSLGHHGAASLRGR